MFTEANAYWRKTDREPLFTIELGGASEKSEIYNGHMTLTPTASVAKIDKTDLIIIPASQIRTYEQAASGNQQLIRWVTQQYKNGAEIASMCSAAFFLATAGLLEGQTCSTHWSYENTFRAMFPNIDLQTKELITDANGIYTNGGAYSFLNLLIYLIEKYYDRQTAIYCSKIFQVEIDRQSQSAFSIFAGQKAHGDEAIQKAQTYIEANLQEKISIERLSAKLALGRRNFDRRFIKATGNTPLEYQQRVRIESAKRAFETSRKTVNEVMYEVGYSDIKAFREVFRKFTGLSPLDYRTRYNNRA